jgi:hypothetical protein
MRAVPKAFDNSARTAHHLTPLSFRWSTVNDLMAGSAEAFKAAPHFELIASNLTHEQEQKLKGAFGCDLSIGSNGQTNQ